MRAVRAAVVRATAKAYDGTTVTMRAILLPTSSSVNTANQLVGAAFRWQN